MDNKSCKGFTLIEMAIVIMIIGLLVASLTPLYARYQESKRIQATEAHINTTLSAIGSFRSLYGRYPCPASLSVPRTDPSYGRENCDLTGIATNSCAGGFCVEQSIRAPLDYQYPIVNGVPTVHAAAQPRIIVGTLPFRHLNIEEDGAYDGYNNRLMYVVTEHLTCANCFQPGGGGIEIVNNSGSVLPEVGTAHFMVFSYGQNSLGAFNKNGIQIDCPDGAGAENENCDFATGDFDATYQISSGNTSGSAQNYDDVVDYFTQDEMPLWQMSTNPNPAARRAIHQKAGGDVAIMMPATDIEQPGDVGGTVRATAEVPLDPAAPTGRVVAGTLCTSGNADCFSPLVIAGKIAEGEGMKCPAGQFMVAIKKGKPICSSNDIKDTCDTGEFATGIDASGNIVCSQTSGCPLTQVQLCNMSFTIQPGAEGTSRTVFAGNSAWLTYKCTNGQWVGQGSVKGSCACTPLDKDETVSCPVGYKGQITRHTVRICPSGKTTYTNVVNACTCIDNYRQTQTESCPTGFSGSIPKERFFNCAASPDSWGPWKYLEIDKDRVTAIANHCSCTNRTETRYTACGAGQTGSIEEKRTITCGPTSVVISPWAPVSGGACEPKVCKWKTSSSPQGPYPFISGANLGSSCGCGASGKCYSFAGAGLYNHYQVCRCE